MAGETGAVREEIAQRQPLRRHLVDQGQVDESLHGAGFVARLSGSTAEFISIWRSLFAGAQPFFMRGNDLCLGLRPALPGWLFPENGLVSFRFLGCCTVTLHNPRRLDTFQDGVQPEKIVFPDATGKSVQVRGAVICPPYAEQVRSGKVEWIEVYY